MKSKFWMLISIMLLASMVLTACAAPTAEKIIETVVVEKEKVVEQTVVSVEEKIVEVTSTPEPPPDTGPVKIVIFVGFGTGTDASQIAVHQQLQDLYNSTHTDIQIEFLTVPHDERITKYSTMLAANQAPDIALPIGVGGIAEFYKGWLDLTPFIDADSYDLNRFAGVTKEIHNYPGQGVLGLPLCVYPQATFYNVDVFDAAGVDYPPAKYGDKYADGTEWDYNKVVEIAKKLTLDANGNDANSPAFDPKTTKQFGWAAWDWASPFDFSVHFGDENGTGVNPEGTKSLLLTKQYIDAANFMKDAIWTSHIAATGEQAGAFYQNAGDPMGSGMIGMWETHTWIGYAYGSWTEKFKWDIGAIPVGTNGKVRIPVDADTAVITASTKHPNEAWEVMKWLYEPEQYKVLIQNYNCFPADTEAAKTWVTDMSAKYPGVNFEIFVDALNYLEGAPNHEAWKPNYTKINDEMSKVIGEINAGTNLDVQALMTTADTAVQKLLDDYWAANK